MKRYDGDTSPGFASMKRYDGDTSSGFASMKRYDGDTSLGFAPDTGDAGDACDGCVAGAAEISGSDSTSPTRPVTSPRGSCTAASSRLISATRSAFSRYGMNALLNP